MIQYNKPHEVTKLFYFTVVPRLSSILAYRQENGKYYIKIMVSSYANFINDLLK